MKICKECGCEIIEQSEIPNRKKYYCQQCCEDKEEYEIEEIN